MKKTILIAMIGLTSSLSYAQKLDVGRVVDIRTVKAAVDARFLRGSEGVGGGDEVGLEFQRYLQEALEDVKVQMPSLFQALEQRDLGTLASTLKTVVADEHLNVRYLSYIQDSVAANIPDSKMILVNRARWATITDDKVKKAIALHEFLSLAKLESTGSYAFSSKYLADQGVSSEYLAAIMKPEIQKTNGLAPRGIPRLEKNPEQMRQEELQRAENKIQNICHVYVLNRHDEMVAAIGAAIVAVDYYSTWYNPNTPERLPIDALRDELSYLQNVAFTKFAQPERYESSMKAFCQ